MTQTEIAITEAQLKYTCESFLLALQNLSKLIYLRLNAGDLILGEGQAKRRVKCCPRGTSDGILVLPQNKGVIFLEYKSDKGKQTRDQVAFEKQVEEQGHEYWIVKDFNAFRDAIQEILRC